MFTCKEEICGVEINVTELAVGSVDLARHIADAKNRQEDDEHFMIVNLDALYERYELWKRELPQIEAFYAVKCNTDLTLLRIFAHLGVGFDCASKEEIDIILRLGVSPSRIIYANTCKTRAFIAHAEKEGVRMMTFDNAEELKKIAKSSENAQAVLRIAVTDPTARCPLSRKFGAEPTKRAPSLLKCAAELGVKVVGVSFHVGSGCNDPTAFRRALLHTRTLFDIGLTLGHKMEIVDLGGGFPGGEQQTAHFEKIAAVIRSGVEELFPDPNVRLIAEPGRFFAQHPFTVVANVISHSVVPDDEMESNESGLASVSHMYYLNDGLYGSFNCILFDHGHPVGRPLFDKQGELFSSTVYGPTCDSDDKIEDNKMMRELEVGDWMIYEEMGAYTSAASSTFNGFQRPTSIYVISERTWKKLGM